MIVLEYHEIKTEQLYQSKTIHFNAKVFTSVATESKLEAASPNKCVLVLSFSYSFSLVLVTVPLKHLQIFPIYTRI